MITSETNEAEAETLALRALAATLADGQRAERLLSLTGLDAEELRRRAGDRALLAAVLAFLAGHEPDLLAVSATLEVSPERLVAAHRALEA